MQSGTSFNIGKNLSRALSSIFWILYWSGKESNIKGQLSAALSQISWVLKHLETNILQKN